MPYWRPQIRTYVILFDGRSGSSLMTELLAAQPDALALGETFASMRKKGESAPAQLAWASGFLARPWRGPHRLIGFKAKLRDTLDPPGFAALLRQRRPHIIHLQRRNLVKGVVSMLRANALFRQTNEWNLMDTGQRQEPFALPAAEFHRLMGVRAERAQELSAYVNALQLPTTEVLYEDMLLDGPAVMRKLCSALGFTYQPVPPRMQKHTSDDLRRDVTNLDELKAAYIGTPYESMFDEVLVEK